MPCEGKQQHARFIEAARALGSDDDKAAFKAKPGVIARQKPKDDATAHVKRGEKAK